MFKQQAVSKLPTLNQYLKEHDLKDEQIESMVEKVFWSDSWRTITFQTETFRYSIKFPDADAFKNAIGTVLDGFIPDRPMLAVVEYDGDTGEVDILWEALEPTEANQTYYQFKQWDWGLTSEPWKFKPKNPASKKKPPSKMTQALSQGTQETTP